MSDASVSYESYETIKLRPKLMSKNNDCAYESRYSGGEIKAKHGHFNIAYPICENFSYDKALNLLKSLSKSISGFDAVALNMLGLNNEQAEQLTIEAAKLFKGKALLFHLANAELYKLCKSFFAGMYIEGMSALQIREAIAKHELYTFWQEQPVYLNANSEDAKEVLRSARSWHVCRCVQGEFFGASLAFRKIAYPAKLSSNGAFPIRLWLQNNGTSPEYSISAPRLAIKQSDKIIPIKLSFKEKIINIGDLTFNEIATLPSLPEGEYPLMAGIFTKNGNALLLANEGEPEDGYYCFGHISLDNTPREELYNAWESYYPEGYYPLEDPKLPY